MVATSHDMEWDFVGLEPVFGYVPKPQDARVNKEFTYGRCVGVSRRRFLNGWSRITIVERLNAADTLTVEAIADSGISFNTLPSMLYASKRGVDRFIGTKTNQTEAMTYVAGKQVKTITATYVGLYDNLYHRIAGPKLSALGIAEAPFERNGTSFTDGSTGQQSTVYRWRDYDKGSNHTRLGYFHPGKWYRNGTPCDVLIEMLIDHWKTPGNYRGAYNVFAGALHIGTNNENTQYSSVGKYRVNYPAMDRVGNVVTPLFEQDKIKCWFEYIENAQGIGEFYPRFEKWLDRSAAIRFGMENDAVLGTIVAYDRSQSRVEGNGQIPLTAYSGQKWGKDEEGKTALVDWEGSSWFDGYRVDITSGHESTNNYATVPDQLADNTPTVAYGTDDGWANTYVEELLDLSQTLSDGTVHDDPDDVAATQESNASAITDYFNTAYANLVDHGFPKDDVNLTIKLSPQLEVGVDVKTGMLVGIDVPEWNLQGADVKQVVREIETTLEGQAGENVTLRVGGSADRLNTVSPRTMRQVMQQLRYINKRTRH